VRRRKKKMAGGGLAASQRSLKAWATKSGQPSPGRSRHETGERYLPKRAIQGAKPRRVRSNNTSKAGRKSPRKTVCAAASKNKAKSKAVPKG